MIEAKSLRKSYGPTVAVRDISFSIDRGEIVGLLGPNGAGKSTTIRMLTTYLVPDNGEIRIEGLDPERDPIAVRRRLGYMPEASALYSEMKVLDYLRFIARVRRIDPGDVMKRIGWASERCGLKDILLKSIGALSKGNKQRVALAQAILHDPEILILDEPTSGLDPNQIRVIREFIRELGTAKTVLLSTHILQEVSALCGRAIVINRGKIVADGALTRLVEEATEHGRFTVAIDGPEGEVEPALTQLEAVTEVTSLDSNRFELATAGDEAAAQIFGLSKDKGWTLTELAPHRLTIEEVFHRLTEEG